MSECRRKNNASVVACECSHRRLQVAEAAATGCGRGIYSLSLSLTPRVDIYGPITRLVYVRVLGSSILADIRVVNPALYNSSLKQVVHRSVT